VDESAQDMENLEASANNCWAWICSFHARLRELLRSGVGASSVSNVVLHHRPRAFINGEENIAANTPSTYQRTEALAGCKLARRSPTTVTSWKRALSGLEM
jgi:hypothetical protein